MPSFLSMMPEGVICDVPYIPWGGLYRFHCWMGTAERSLTTGFEWGELRCVVRFSLCVVVE